MNSKRQSSTPYRYVACFNNQYRVLIPRPGVNEHTVKYCSLETPLEEIKQILVDGIHANGFSDAEAEILMKDWPKKWNDVDKKHRVNLGKKKNNQSGYLGVSVYANLKSVKYCASFYSDGKLKKIKVQVVLLNEVGQSSVYCLDRDELKAAFVKACMVADELRSIPLKADDAYLKYYVDVDWEDCINIARRKKGLPLLKVMLADSKADAKVCLSRFVLGKEVA